jgi:hypothetical protein
MFVQEENRLLTVIKSRFNVGEEFKAKLIFDLLSQPYLDWYKSQAERNRVYCLNYTESAALEILESLMNKGILRKRSEIRNEYGDEDWYYALVG